MTRKTAPVTKADYELLSEFRYQLRRFMRFSEDAVQGEGVTPLQYQLMLHLKGFPGREWATIGELAERLQAQHHGVVALVTRCESAGLVQRVTGAVDRRQVEVHLTKRGEQCIARLAALHRTELRSLSNVFSVRNIGAFNDESES
ncbi:MarR family winged helix-turn-helix transcriptional regulator [Azohydromonas australica]|uniref:MarR family winged helix-turn-helix transcriptional regulator n=1 Tax=Azohydromonas australica TaxID=364039 RepID=UPI00048DF3EA|nr:MarR family transcriptional regulator [Azohydromonas australica]